MYTTTRDPTRREIRQRSRLACDECAKSRVKCPGNYPCRRCIASLLHHYTEGRRNTGPVIQRLCHRAENGYDCRYDRNIKKRGRKRKDQLSANDDRSVLSNRDMGLQNQFALDVQDSLDAAADDTLLRNAVPQASPSETVIAGSFETLSNHAEVGWVDPDLPPPLLAQDISQEPFNGEECQARSIGIGQHEPGRNAQVREASCSRYESDASRDQYACLAPLLPYIEGIIRASLARELLELYFAPSEGSLFHNASPYVLTPVMRKESVLNSACLRPTTAALLATMIWVSAQTASLPQLLSPGSRESLCSSLQKLVFRLQRDRDLENWGRFSGQLVREPWNTPSVAGAYDGQQPPKPVIDDVLSLILITTVISGGDFKRDCLPWWTKALRLIETMKIHQMDQPNSQWDDNPIVCLPSPEERYQHPRPEEAKEEMRRTFWLAFALDRHLALSYNGDLAIVDGENYVFAPLPERVWQDLDEGSLSKQPSRHPGPSSLVTGTGFFEFFLPLMVLLGDIVHLRRQRNHPRFGKLDSTNMVSLIERLLDDCEKSIEGLPRLNTDQNAHNPAHQEMTSFQHIGTVLQGATPDHSAVSVRAHEHFDRESGNPRIQLVTAYSRFILHVLHILLHGEWDALTMLAWSPSPSSSSEWITSPSFLKCSSHAVYGSESISSILEIDPELNFMPYLLGIYLFHGSLVLLLFADRMPAVHGGPNNAVEAACETVIRAHEACIVTLNTEFQRVFKTVMRATLMVVKDKNKTGWMQDRNHGADERSNVKSTEFFQEKIFDMRKEMLRLNRWSSGGRGLAI